MNRRFRGVVRLVVAATCILPAWAQETWMGDLKPRIGHMQLNQLAIPGTHDSGTSTLDPNMGFSIDFVLGPIQTKIDQALNDDPILSPIFDGAFDGVAKTFIKPWAVAQGRSVYEQLNAGIRYLDLRPCAYPDPGSVTDIRICHSLFGESLGNIFTDVRQFSLAHPDEIILLDVNHISNNSLTGSPSDLLATTILDKFTKVSTGDMLIRTTNITPTSTLDQIWAQPGRIIVLYDDATLAFARSWFWPGQGVPDNAAIGSPARVHSPWPGVNNPDAELAAFNQYFDCRCDDPKSPNQVVPDALFVLQTNPTPDLDLLGAAFVNSIENATTTTGPLGNTICWLCPVLDPIKGAFHPPSFIPTDLHDLSDQANYEILPTIIPRILASHGALRRNLNIVQADRFDEMYDFSKNIVPSDFVESMIFLNTPPQTFLTIGSPQYSDAGNHLFVTSGTPFTLHATDSHFELNSVSHGYSPQGTNPTLQPTSGASAQFTLAAPAQDGSYEVDWFATSMAGVAEHVNSKQAIMLDNTPPAITVTQPAVVAYPHSSTLTLNFGLTDGQGSGVKTVTAPTLDGAGAIGGQALANGLSINLLTQLALGSHTFVYGGAMDNVGNSSAAKSVTFTVVATAESIKADVGQFITSGAISNANWANSLSDKLNQAALARAAGSCSQAASIYSAFINELSAQSGKKVTPFAAAVMTSDAQYMIAHCP